MGGPEKLFLSFQATSKPVERELFHRYVTANYEPPLHRPHVFFKYLIILVLAIRKKSKIIFPSFKNLNLLAPKLISLEFSSDTQNNISQEQNSSRICMESSICSLREVEYQLFNGKIFLNSILFQEFSLIQDFLNPNDKYDQVKCILSSRNHFFLRQCVQFQDNWGFWLMLADKTMVLQVAFFSQSIKYIIIWILHFLKNPTRSDITRNSYKKFCNINLQVTLGF